MAASISITRNGTPCILLRDLASTRNSAAQDPAELAHVDLGHQDLAVTAEHLAQVRRERVEVAQMGMGRLHATGPDPLHTGRHGGVRRAPAHQQELGVARLVVHLEQRDVLGDAGDLVVAQMHHAFVVDPVVGDVPAAVGLLETADAVLEAGQPGWGPGAGEGLRIADVRPERPRSRPHRCGSGAEAKLGSIGAKASRSGSFQGSAPLAR